MPRHPLFPSITLAERACRTRREFPPPGEGWEIEFRVFVRRRWISGYLIPSLRRVNGLPAAFLAFQEDFFLGCLVWTEIGWVNDSSVDMDDDLVYQLGCWVEIWYQ
jgi:hypothetical protein